MRSPVEPARPRVMAPASCPYCQSSDVKTTSKTIDESTYWRCRACGQIWNPGRLRQSAIVFPAASAPRDPEVWDPRRLAHRK